MYNKLIELKEKYQKEKDIYTKKSNSLSNIRLILFIIILVLHIYIKMEYTKNIPITIIIVTLIITFIGIVIYHNKIAKKEELYQNYIDIINTYSKKRRNEYQNKHDNFEGNDLSEDLDLIGPNSLFELINISKSINSKQSLINKIINPKINEKDILQNQQAIKELAEYPEFILDYIFMINNIKNLEEKDYEKSLTVLDDEKHISKKELIFGIITSIISVTILILGIFNIINIRFFIIVMIIQTIISYLYQFKFNKELSKIATSSRLFTDYKKIYQLLNDYNFNSIKLNKIKKELLSSEIIIKNLERVCNLDGYRYNFITNVILNTIMSLNIVVLYKYNVLITNNIKVFKNNTKLITELENLISLTTIPLIKDNISLPKISKKTTLNIKNISHPLLNEQECIKNDFNTLDDINIITGSNMSGKTSFIRTIAINLILMYNGTYVNAEEFTSSLNKIFTSIRVTDDISAGISTFYGELLRIEKILKYSETNKDPIIVFIDEIFKGTNYNDRILGAKEIIKKLSKLNCIIFITTHDFELCEIDNKKIYNYHFEEQYTDNKISFDYKIKDGMCTKTNAKYLMKQIGIIDK